MYWIFQYLQSQALNSFFFRLWTSCTALFYLNWEMCSWKILERYPMPILIQMIRATSFIALNKWNMRDRDLVTPLLRTKSRSLYDRRIHHWHRNCGVKSQISKVKGVLDTREMIESAVSLCCGFYCVCQSVFTWGGVRRDCIYMYLPVIACLQVSYQWWQYLYHTLTTFDVHFLGP